MSIQLDLNKAHLSRVHGDVTAIYTWINDDRAMVLAATYRPGSPFMPGAPLYVILEKNAHAYDNPVQLARTAQKASEVLGLDASTVAWHKLATIIIDGLPDLIRMPHAPDNTLLPGSYGAVTLRADGKEIAGREVRMEKDGVEYA